MLDLVSIEDRAGQCPFCSSAVEVSRAAFYIRSESPDVGFSVDGEPIESGTVSEDAAFRPMKGQQSGVGEDSLGRLVGSQIISQIAVETLLENNSDRAAPRCSTHEPQVLFLRELTFS